jgi:hypothetical protein
MGFGVAGLAAPQPRCLRLATRERRLSGGRAGDEPSQPRTPRRLANQRWKIGPEGRPGSMVQVRV